MIEPPFIWPGNKRMHLDKVLPLLPYTSRFVDVFGGSGVVLLNTPFHELDVFNDINSHVANFFRCLAHRATKRRLIHQIEMHVHSRELFEEYREDKDSIEDPVDRAVAWFYTIETSFSRLGRHYGRNMQASFETRRVYERLKYFEQVHLRVRHCYIENKNAFDLAMEYDAPDTVFYMDPPYINNPTGTYKHNEINHHNLLQLIGMLQGHVVLSGEPNDLYDSQHYWSHIEKWPAASRIKATSRSKGRFECLWVKPSMAT